MKLFSPDAPIMRVMSAVADLLLFNLLFLLLALPVVTAGAAATALYAVTGRLVRGEEYSVAYFFKTFRQSFPQASVAWLIRGAAALALMASFVLAGVFGSAVRLIVSGILLFLGFVWLITCSWTFPLLSQFENGVGSTIANALKLGVAYLPRSVLMGLVNLFPWGLLYFHIGVFATLVPLWLTVWFSGAALLASFLIKKPLAPYRGSDPDSGAQDGE